MRIAQLTKYFHPHRGGIESNVLGISQGLVDRGNEILVFTSNIPQSRKYEILDVAETIRQQSCRSFETEGLEPKPRTYVRAQRALPHGIEVHRSTNFFTIFNDPFTPGIIIGLLKKDYDLIHLHLPDPFNSIFALIASILKKKPLVVTYHADIIKDEWYHKPFKFIYNIFLYFVLRHSKKIIATTPNYVDSSAKLRKFKNKIEIVPNFVDTERFNPKLDGSRIRKLYNLNGKKIILFIGRLVPYKGVEYLIKAFAGVKKELENSALLIVGNGPLKEKLKRFASQILIRDSKSLEAPRQSLGLTRNIEYIAMKNLADNIDDVYFINAEDEDIPFYYASCDVFVLSSITRQEAFGISLIEAMACGKPVIATNISGMPYIVDNSGIIVNPKEIDELKDAILKILSDKKLAEDLGKRARNRVEEKFATDIVVDKIEKIYISVR